MPTSAAVWLGSALESGRIIVVKEWNVTTTCLASIKLNQLYLLYVIMRPSMLEPALRTATLSLCLSVPLSTCPPVCPVPVHNCRTKTSRRLKITTKYVHVMYITRIPFLGQGHLVNIYRCPTACVIVSYTSKFKNEMTKTGQMWFIGFPLQVASDTI